MSELFDKNVFPDRPWTGRGYGRIRLDEPLAHDLNGIMYEVIRERLNAYHEAKNRGGDPVVEKLALRRASKIKERVYNLIHEQGWDAEGSTTFSEEESDVR